MVILAGIHNGLKSCQNTVSPSGLVTQTYATQTTPSPTPQTFSIGQHVILHLEPDPAQPDFGAIRDIVDDYEARDYISRDAFSQLSASITIPS
jgi:hypothetical protein